MAKNLFEGVTPLSPKRHGKFFLSTDAGYNFAAEQPSVPLQVSEFAAIAREYAIAFLQQGETFHPIAVLGLAEKENLFVDENGAWKAKYIPAFYRMYPFVLVKVKDKENMVLGIAEQYAGLNEDGDGDPLFDADGQASKIVKNVETFATQSAHAAKLTDRLVSDLSGLDIFVPIRLQLKGPGETSRAIGGLHVVDRKKLGERSGKDLRKLTRSGTLEAIYAHLGSLRNLRALADRLGHETDLPENDELDALKKAEFRHNN